MSKQVETTNMKPKSELLSIIDEASPVGVDAVYVLDKFELIDSGIARIEERPDQRKENR